jgi:mRNA-degrading endonuclease RelE of RelBE toxin-antitoxin system
MDAIQKILKKMKQEDRERVFRILKLIKEGSLQGEKLKGENQFRIRVGSYRLLYRIEKESIIIDGVKIRNEKTYK